MGFADNALTCDGFLGGKLRILQPRAGYRAATDPVFFGSRGSRTGGPKRAGTGLRCGGGAIVFGAQGARAAAFWGVITARLRRFGTTQCGDQWGGLHHPLC